MLTGNGEALSAEDFAAFVALGGYDPNGKRVRKVAYGQTKKECQEKLRRLQADYALGEMADPQNMSVGAWLMNWLENTAKVKTSPTTWERYEQLFKNFGWDVVILKYGSLQQAAFKEPGGEKLRQWIDNCHAQAMRLRGNHRHQFGLDEVVDLHLLEAGLLEAIDDRPRVFL